jgi:hypothetical protein
MKNASDIPEIPRQQSQRKPEMVKRLANKTVRSIATLYEHTVARVAAQPVPVRRACGRHRHASVDKAHALPEELA